jgi:hypothetical protein
MKNAHMILKLTIATQGDCRIISVLLSMLSMFVGLGATIRNNTSARYIMLTRTKGIFRTTKARLFSSGLLQSISYTNTIAGKMSEVAREKRLPRKKRNDRL